MLTSANIFTFPPVKTVLYLATFMLSSNYQSLSNLIDAVLLERTDHAEPQIHLSSPAISIECKF